MSYLSSFMSGLGQRGIPQVKDKAPDTEKAKSDKMKISGTEPEKKSGGVIHVLDKIGDVIIFPIVKLAELTDLADKPDKKK